MIEIDLRKLERGTREGWVTVKRGAKIFRRRQRLGQKETISIPESGIPPNLEIMSAMREANDKCVKHGWHTNGFTKVNEMTGEFTYRRGPYLDWTGGVRTEYEAGPIDFRVEGNTIIREDNNTRVTIPESEIANIEGYYKGNSPKWISLLDGEWGNSTLIDNYMRFKMDSEEYNKQFDEIDDFTPEFENEFEEGNAKYSKRMGLKSCSNYYSVVDVWLSEMWYTGDSDYTSLVGEAVQEVLKGKYNSDNVIQQQIPLMIKTAKKINELHGGDNIYRGETNTETARDILEQLDEFNNAEIADKLFSCTENEKLAKWYASSHNQETARGIRTKTHIMLKIPREKFGDNVVMDYRSTGSCATTEEEVTIVGNDITLTADDVMVNATTPKHKNKKWMSFSQFKSAGGVTQDLIDNMVGAK